MLASESTHNIDSLSNLPKKQLQPIYEPESRTTIPGMQNIKSKKADKKIKRLAF